MDRRSVHAYFFKYLVEAADFQRDCKGDDFGDTLNTESDFRIPDGNPFAVPAKNTDSELTAIYLSKFWYVGGNCTSWVCVFPSATACSSTSLILKTPPVFYSVLLSDSMVAWGRQFV